MFQLFNSFKDEKNQINMKGIGLGLVICKMIVQKFNGCIDFISEFQKGSSFFYTFEIEDYDSQNHFNELQSHKSAILSNAYSNLSFMVK